MATLEYREEPVAKDPEHVGRLLAATGFFTPEEQKIGISLVEERLLHGLASGYLFVFMEEDGMPVGYTCYGPIPGTLDGFDLYWIAIDPKMQGERIGSTVAWIHREEGVRARGQASLCRDFLNREVSSNPRVL